MKAFNAILALVCAISTSSRAQTPAPAGAPAKICETMPEAQQLNFWIGNWDVNPWQGGTFPNGKAGHSDVHPLLNHCFISENWTSPRGNEGKSMNFYDTNIGKWRQMWIGDTGGALTYTGEYRDGAMRFEGWTLGTKGDTVLQKLTFFNISSDTVRQLFEASNDRGRTWQPTFDARYVRVKR